MKASALNAQFGAEPLMILGESRRRTAQSTKSREFHFERARLCKGCNSERTQAADLAFDKLRAGLFELRKCNLPLTDENHQPQIELSAETELNSFRYFAKLLLCSLIEFGGPRSLYLAQFCLGEVDQNRVNITIAADDEYDKWKQVLGSSSFAKTPNFWLNFNQTHEIVTGVGLSFSTQGLLFQAQIKLSLLESVELENKASELVERGRYESRNLVLQREDGFPG